MPFDPNSVSFTSIRHWQLRTPWVDGPEFVTQCPFQPGASYTYTCIGVHVPMSLYNADAKTYSLRFSQEVPATPDSSGKDMPLFSVNDDGKLEHIGTSAQPTYYTVLKVTKVPSVISGTGLTPGVRFCCDAPDGGLTNVAATVINLHGFYNCVVRKLNLHGFEASSDYEIILIEVDN